VAAHPTRRVMLAAAAILPLAAATGCDGVDVLSAPPRPAPDVALLRSAIAAELLMVAHYSNALSAARHPGATPAAGRGTAPAALAAALEPVLAEHRAHLAQLRSRLIVPAGAAPLPSERVPAAPAVPAAPGAAVAFLRAAEQAAATALLDRLPQAPASLAQLFASISASEATHVPVLDAVLAAGRAGG
jgi:hypothetical protein